MEKKFNLTTKYIFFVFIISTTSCILTGLLVGIFSALGFIQIGHIRPFMIIVLFFVASIIIGLLLSFFISKKTIRSLSEILKAVEEIGKGNFNVNLDQINGNELLDSISENINQMIVNLRNLEMMRTDFIQNFSHEFKTPIVSIQGFAKRLLTKDLNEETKKEYLTIIYEESNRLSKLALNTLFLSKLDNSIALNKKEYQLDTQIRQAVLLLEKEWSKKSLNINLELDNTPYFGDEEITMQVWINLISNAIKFSNESGTILITSINYLDNIIVNVCDNGIGISDVTKIFERYYKEDLSRKTDGFGLGLAIVKKIIKQIDGEISVVSEINKGTTFTVTLANKKQ